MTYNKSEIMKAAWEIRKIDGVDMSIAMRAAWAVAKAEAAANAELDRYCGHAKVVVNDWRKGNHSRTYIEVRHYTNAWNLKHITKIGYVDNKRGVLVAA